MAQPEVWVAIPFVFTRERSEEQDVEEARDYAWKLGLDSKAFGDKEAALQHVRDLKEKAVSHVDDPNDYLEVLFRRIEFVPATPQDGGDERK